MTEVEKLYELAGVEPNYDYFTFFDDKVHKIGRTMHLCKEELKHWLENYQKDYVAIKVIRVDKIYPPFTAEKQLELIKWLAKFDDFYVLKDFEFDKYRSLCGLVASEYIDTFEEMLANLILNIWDELTKAQKKQIKEILE